jgi:hypothetical protein
VDGLTHGKPSTYTNRRCRCAPCSEAHAEYLKELRDRRYAQRFLRNGRWIAPLPHSAHGRQATYTNWGCRCPWCTEANSAKTQQYRHTLRQRQAEQSQQDLT